MDVFLNIMQMSDNDIEKYVDTLIMNLNSSPTYDDVSLDNDSGGIIYPGWINIDTLYRPSGYKSKAFKLTRDFYIDWCRYIRNGFANIDIKKLSKMNDDLMVELINIYVTLYFGGEYDEKRRKEIFCYGDWKAAFEFINIDSIKGENVARCIEKSAAFNGISNIMGVECSLVLSDAMLNNEDKVGHAYCLLRLNGKHVICDPTFRGIKNNNRGIPFIFDLNEDAVVFDSGKFGDIDPIIVEYDFPWDEFRKNNGRFH